MESLSLLIFFASIMVTAIAGIIYYTEMKTRTYVQLFFSFFVLIMMYLMLVGAIVYLYSPSTFSLGIAVAINMIPMIIILALFFSIAENLSRQIILTRKINIAFSLLLVLNEALMGGVFSLAQLGISVFKNVVVDISIPLNSVWFFYPMMIEMLFTIILSSTLSKDTFYNLIYFAFPAIGVAAFPPTILNFNLWIFSALGIDMIFVIYGILKANKEWKILYSLLMISLIPIIFNFYIFFGIMMSVIMVFYYYTILSELRVKRAHT
ncbi:hypothetical protein DFR86_04735 [Acidianus sulfidivorans JP7]|uniref:Uncharacterized protein n=1 Tax=Acidianus sulfidivorans JP7 TaxID=619593 RepID=A0A2U9ILN9_9CREN|nr:hypothetical protein [Acidianus sulfidivorans]AWR96932.1 hypothetical protein DFR86_04735 [Acidianus sulfidivorans JP7]